MSQKANKPVKLPSLGERLHAAEISREVYHQYFDGERARADKLETDLTVLKSQHAALERDYDEVVKSKDEYRKMMYEERDVTKTTQKKLTDAQNQLQYKDEAILNLTADLQRALGYIDRCLEAELPATVNRQAGELQCDIVTRRGPVLQSQQRRDHNRDYL